MTINPTDSITFHNRIQRALAVSCLILAIIVGYLLYSNYFSVIRLSQAFDSGYRLSNMENIQRRLSATHLAGLQAIEKRTDGNIKIWTDQRALLANHMLQSQGEARRDPETLSALENMSAQLSRYDSLTQAGINQGSPEAAGDIVSELNLLYETMSSDILTQFNRSERGLFPAIESGLQTLRSSQSLLIVVNIGLLLMLAGLVQSIRRESADRLDQSRRHQTLLESHVNAKTEQLNSANTQLAIELRERKQAQEALRIAHDELEERVHHRTKELAATNTALQMEIQERQRAQKAIAAANDRLSHALRARDLFIATISHELRTPLNVILLSCEALNMKLYGELAERQAAIIDRINNSGTHLLTLINDILDLAKSDSNQLELEITRIDAHEIGRDAVDFVAPAADVKEIVLDYKIRLEDGTLLGDARRLKQVLINLLDNAIKFTNRGGHATLELGGDDENVYFTVSDDGIGIAQEHQEQLFEPFVQVDSRLSREYDGTGLGLALVERIAILHGGSVHLISAVGEGSKFTVTIPR